jgi:hypothetical protein
MAKKDQVVALIAQSVGVHVVGQKKTLQNKLNQSLAAHWRLVS